MSLLSSIKPFLPFLLTFLIPRCISYYRALKTAIKTRPPPRPLPAKTSRSLNILFISICLFLFLSLPLYSPSTSFPQPNIFELTNSRLNIPTDVLFARLALLRPLTATDEALREKITTPITRFLYLKYGPQTLLTCPFCTPHQPLTYALHHLPTHILLPHLLHLFLLGLATSNPISGTATSRFRTKFSLSALTLALLDVYFSTIYTQNNPSTSISAQSTRGIYWIALTLRPLSIALHDLISAALIYVILTNCLPFLFPLSLAPSTSSESTEHKSQQLRTLTQSNLLLQTTLTKLRAYGVAHSAVVRDPELKEREDAYWRFVVGMEGPPSSGSPAGGVGDRTEAAGGAGGSIWEEEEVMQAMAGVMRKGAAAAVGGGVDVEGVRREAEGFVEGVLRGLDDGDEQDETSNRVAD